MYKHSSEHKHSLCPLPPTYRPALERPGGSGTKTVDGDHVWLNVCTHLLSLTSTPVTRSPPSFFWLQDHHCTNCSFMTGFTHNRSAGKSRERKRSCREQAASLLCLLKSWKPIHPVTAIHSPSIYVNFFVSRKLFLWSSFLLLLRRREVRIVKLNLA